MADQGKIPTELEKIESGAIAIDAVNRCMLHLVREDEYPNMYILSGLIYANQIIVQQVTSSLGSVDRNLRRSGVI